MIYTFSNFLLHVMNQTTSLCIINTDWTVKKQLDININQSFLQVILLQDCFYKQFYFFFFFKGFSPLSHFFILIIVDRQQIWYVRFAIHTDTLT